MIVFKITEAHADKHNSPDDGDYWDVIIHAVMKNYEDIQSTKHNKIMPIASKFFKTVREEIGIKSGQLSVFPNVISSKKDKWSCRFPVYYKDNEEETVHYMIWWLSSCKGREYDV